MLNFVVEYLSCLLWCLTIIGHFHSRRWTSRLMWIQDGQLTLWDRSYKIDRFYFIFISFSGLPRCAWNSWGRWTKRTTCECLALPWYVRNKCSQSELQETHCLFHGITPTFPLSAANGAISRFSQLLLESFQSHIYLLAWMHKKMRFYNVVMIGDQRKPVHGHWKWSSHCTVCGMDIPAL